LPRLLLTGAAGFAGSHCLRHILANTDWDVTCPVSLDHKGHMGRIEFACAGQDPARVRIVPCDLAQPLTGKARILFGQPDLIINYASNSHVDRSIVEPVPFTQNNVNLMLTMLQFARTLPGLKAFVQVSTDEVYGACSGDPHAEWSPIVPSNVYAATKACQEALAIAYWRTYGVPLIIVNCMNLFGEAQGLNGDRVPEKFVPLVASKVLAGETVPIHASPDGRPGSRCWLHARNLADGILWLLRRDESRKYQSGTTAEPKPQRWNITGAERSNLDMAREIAAGLGRELRYELVDFHSSRPGHDLRYSLSGRKLADAGWVAPVSFEEGVRRMVNWEMEHDGYLRRDLAHST
jgi:dTDP-glucose 4,6-dehydratase